VAFGLRCGAATSAVICSDAAGIRLALAAQACGKRSG